MSEILKYLKTGPVIFIDFKLGKKEKKSWLTDRLGETRIEFFNTFDRVKNAENRAKLMTLRTLEDSNVVVHLHRDGGIGLDLRMKFNAHVIMNDKPVSLAELY